MDDSYMAGIFDGEGWVRIQKYVPPARNRSNHIRYQLYGGINMCHRPVIEAIALEYGGVVGNTKPNPDYPNTRIQFGLRWASQIMATILRRIQPYSIVKKLEIDLALELQANIDANPYVPLGRRGVFRENRDELLAFREDLFQRMLVLKHQTFPPITTQGARKDRRFKS